MSLLPFFQLLRIKHWIKNLFVFAPLIFSGKFLSAPDFILTCIAFFFFGLAASAVYILNDLIDVKKDRLHPKKKSRPLASGTIPSQSAKIILLSLYLCIALSYLFSRELCAVLCAYILLNVSYSFWLKTQAVLDIFSIALGFVLRVYAGGQTLNIPVSSWMFVTTFCLALYLASIKRRQELLLSDQSTRPVLESYSISLVEKYAQISATGALIFYSLFVFTIRPNMVLSIPLVLFGIFRYWFLVEQQDAGESPGDVLLSDVQLFLCVFIWFATCLWSLIS